MRRLILFALNVSSAHAVLIVGPQNAAVFAGEKMSMDCRTDGESTVRRWEVYNTSYIWNTVYSRGRAANFVDRFSHFGAEVNANGSGFIYTNSVKIDDAGIYKCFARRGGRDVEESAQLIVFESAPICETVFTPTDNYSLSDGQHILMRCRIAFRGFWTPTLEWRRHDGKGHRSGVGKRIAEGIEVLRLQNKAVTSTLAIRINESAKGSFYSCQISFAQYDSQDIRMIATNFPDFFYFWSSDVTPRMDVEVCATTSSSALFFNFITLSCFVLIFFAAAVYLKCKRRVSDVITKSVEEQSVQPEPEAARVTDVQNPAAEEETKNHMVATSDQYCALETRPSIIQEPTDYCELILYEQPHNV